MSIIVPGARPSNILIRLEVRALAINLENSQDWLPVWLIYTFVLTFLCGGRRAHCSYTYCCQFHCEKQQDSCCLCVPICFLAWIKALWSFMQKPQRSEGCLTVNSFLISLTLFGVQASWGGKKWSLEIPFVCTEEKDPLEKKRECQKNYPPRTDPRGF